MKRPLLRAKLRCSESGATLEFVKDDVGSAVCFHDEHGQMRIAIDIADVPRVCKFLEAVERFHELGAWDVDWSQS